MSDRREVLKRRLRKGRNIIGALIVLVLAYATVVSIRHAWDRRHVKVIYLDDIEAWHPDGILQLSAKDQARAMMNDAAFDDFANAFAEEENCRGFLLVRDTAVHRNSSWSFPYAYWFVNLNPMPTSESLVDSSDAETNYSRLNWQVQLVIGDEYLHSDITQSSKTAKDAAQSICAIAANKGGSVW